MTRDWMDDLLEEELKKEVSVPLSVNQALLEKVNKKEEKIPYKKEIVGILLLSLIYRVYFLLPSWTLAKNYLTLGKTLVFAYAYLFFLGAGFVTSLVLINKWKKGEI